jgi:minor extracellular serine protease Vpr
MSGPAPGAFLGNYNVFPGGVVNARSEDILNAVDAAIADGMDVLNLSLGGTPGKGKGDTLGKAAGIDVLSIGLDNAVDAGLVVAVAAGNSGPGAETVESPGRAPRVITAGASTNQHFIGEPFTYPSGGSTTIGAAVGQFPALPTTFYSLFDTGNNACTSVSSASGQLTIVNRGTCTFSAKVRNAIAAGAVGVVVVNNVAGDPTAMATDGLGGDNLPAVMIGLKEGAALRASGVTTASAVVTFSEFITANKDILAGFSSQGPTTPDLLINQVKSALANTADRVIKDAKKGTMDVGPTAQGAGRENLTHAAAATISFEPDSASFGRISSSVTIPTLFTFILSNTTGASQTFSLTALRFTPSTSASLSPFDAGTTASGDDRINFPDSVTVPANNVTTLTVSVKSGLAPGAVVQGWITLTGPSGPYHFAYYAVVGP